MATESKSNSAGLWQMIAAMVLSGLIGVFVVEAKQPAINVVYFRCAIGALALGCYCWAKGYFKREYFSLPRLALMLAGGAFLLTNWLLLFESYTLTSITVATIVYHTQPFFVLIIGSVLFRERLGIASILWTLLAFVGVVFISDINPMALDKGESYITGVLFALGAAFCYGIATLIVKRLKGVKPHIIAFVQVALGAVTLWPLVRFNEFVWEVGALSWLVALGVVFTGFMYILLYGAFAQLRVAQIAVLSFIYPAVAVIVDYFVYNYQISLGQFFGMALVGVSSYSLSRSRT